MESFRACWTLRVDHIGDFIYRLIKHIDNKNAKQVPIALTEEEKHMERLAWGDVEEFNPSYLMPSMHLLPKHGATANWQPTQDYWEERELLPQVDLIARYSTTANILVDP